jgi:pyrimidine operon attenuation protein / uracil phosphoribosyltransferase
MEATTEKIKIISAGAISAMLRRIAFEIYERNFGAEQLILAGIGPRGAYLADLLEAHLGEISKLKLMRADFAKLEHGLAWKAEPAPQGITNGTLLIVDDVLYSGNTIVKALALVAPLQPAKIQTAVLIDRGHHRFPIQGNYVGMEIATSLKQYVSVEVDTETQRAEAFIF